MGHWLEGTVSDCEDEHAYYVRAGAVHGHAFWRTAPLARLWGATDSLESDYDGGKPVMFGHWQPPVPLLAANKIGMGTGAYQSNVLTAIRLPDRAIFQARR